MGWEGVEKKWEMRGETVTETERCLRVIMETQYSICILRYII